MRLLLTLTLLMMGFVGYSQNDTTKYYKSLDYGWNYQRLKARAAMVLPSDTVTNKLGIVTIDTTLFVGNGIRWVRVGAGGGGTTIDTTSLSNRINQKLSTSDSSIYYTKFRSDTSRSNIYTAIDTKLNKSDTVNAFLISVSQPNDSSLTFVKGTTSTNYIIRASTAGSATRLITRVYNNTGSTIAKGSVVYISGRHSSNLPTIALAEANNEANSYKTFALVENDIPTSNAGNVIQAGNIGNLNLPTSTYTDGDIVYLSPTVPGGITIVKPLAPFHICKIGSVTRAHPTFGSIEIKIENGWQLDEMSDVQIAAVPNDSTLLQYSRVDSLWHDVSITNAIGNNYLKPSDSTIYQPKFRTDTARTNIYTALAARLNRSDSSIYQPKFRSDTARTNIYSSLNTKLNTSDSTIYQTKFRSDTARTNVWSQLAQELNISDSNIYYTRFRADTSRSNIYTGIAGKFTLPSLTSGSVLFSNGTTIAQKNANFFWDNTNNRLGLGTTSPANSFDVVRGTAGAMGRGNFESGSFSFNGDAKVGVYTSSSTVTDGAGIAFAQTNLQANSRYPGFELQYVYSSTVASNAMRFNYTERSAAGAVQNFTANVLQAFADGTVTINPTASGVTATAKLLVGTASSTHMFDVNGTARVNQLFLRALNTAPASATATGTTGEIRIDANFIYVCTATNTWKRVAIATW